MVEGRLVRGDDAIKAWHPPHAIKYLHFPHFFSFLLNP
jgi:hypothetical protein